MRIISKCLNIVVSLSLILTHSAWAATTHIRAVDDYNSLSQAEKSHDFHEYYKTYPNEDQKILRQRLGDISKISWPIFHHKDGKISFEIEAKRFEIDSIDIKNKVLRVNGEWVEFGPGKLHVLFGKIDSLFANKTFSFMSLFVNDAHATALHVMGAAILLFMAVYTVDHYWSMEQQRKLRSSIKVLMKFCEEDSPLGEKSVKNGDMKRVERYLKSSQKYCVNPVFTLHRRDCKYREQLSECYHRLIGRVESGDKGSNINSSFEGKEVLLRETPDSKDKSPIKVLGQ